MSVIRTDVAEIDLAYTAGILDGEGTITVSKSMNRSGRFRYYLIVTIAMVDPEIPQWLLDTFGSFLYTSVRKPPQRMIYIWRAENKNAATFLSLLLPYLRLKRARAEWAVTLASMARKKVVANHKGQIVPLGEEEEGERAVLASKIRAANQRIIQ